MIEIVERILRIDGTEDELNALLAELERLSPDPDVVRFFHDQAYAGYDAESIVDELLSYRPIQL